MHLTRAQFPKPLLSPAITSQYPTAKHITYIELKIRLQECIVPGTVVICKTCGEEITRTMHTLQPCQRYLDRGHAASLGVKHQLTDSMLRDCSPCFERKKEYKCIVCEPDS
jgi:hypothetical protein